MLIKNPVDIRPSEITSKDNYLNRREFIRAGAIAGGTLLGGSAIAAVVPDGRRAKLSAVGESPFSTDEAPNSYEDITTYNNYYEFGTGKSDPFENAQDFKPRPWSITVDGHAEKTGTFSFEDFMKPFDLDAAHAVDALLEIEWPNEVFEVERAGLLRVALDRDRPGSRLEILRVLERVGLARPELVVVVVGRDVLVTVERLVSAVVARPHVR